MLTETHIHCPWCGAPQTVLLDTSAGSQEYIEDCQICCNPVVFTISTDINGELSDFQVKRDNE